MKPALVFLILAYVAADRHQRHRNCGLPTFTSRLPKNAQEQILKIWENYEDGDDCDKEYRETKQVQEMDLIETDKNFAMMEAVFESEENLRRGKTTKRYGTVDALPEDVRSRAIRSKGPRFLKNVSSDARAQFDALWKNYTISKDDKMEKLKELAERLLKKDQLEEFNKFYAAMQRRKEEFQRKVDQLTPEARAAHDKLVKLREERNKIFMEASEGVRTELNNLYHDARRRHDQERRKTTGVANSE
ncbi:unnamed protein product [Angiostrongylus costaricensis]|uniref:DUF148 domain-containing protein n=1 Tax=Angiostrongylus costaricensis TaxID=334426 RepID=A0A0R3PXM6_ANGCS|nr:unnamed protein product [Angiostrongylus costaricensis]